MVALIGRLLLVVLLLASCGKQESSQLAALRADPLARAVPDGAKEVRFRASDQGRGVGGKQVLAEIQRVLEVDGTGTAQLAALVSTAEQSGWVVAPVDDSEAAAVRKGTRQADNGMVRLSLALVTDPRLLSGDVTPPAIVVSLEHAFS